MIIHLIKWVGACSKYQDMELTVDCRNNLVKSMQQNLIFTYDQSVKIRISRVHYVGMGDLYEKYLATGAQYICA